MYFLQLFKVASAQLCFPGRSVIQFPGQRVRSTCIVLVNFTHKTHLTCYQNFTQCNYREWIVLKFSQYSSTSLVPCWYRKTVSSHWIQQFGLAWYATLKWKIEGLTWLYLRFWFDGAKRSSEIHSVSGPSSSLVLPEDVSLLYVEQARDFYTVNSAARAINLSENCSRDSSLNLSRSSKKK